MVNCGISVPWRKNGSEDGFGIEMVGWIFEVQH